MARGESRDWKSDELVPGLKVRMKSSELKAHLQARAAYHRKRRDEKREILPQMKEAAEKLKSQAPAAVVAQFSKGGMSNYRFDGDDAVEQLQTDIDNHHNKSVAFDWLSEHLFEEDYCLEGSSLVSLEILKTAI